MAAISPPELPMFVINMDTRPERLAALHEAFPDFSITRFPAVRPPDGNGERGCRESHFGIIRLAKERGYPWVLIMEDDCAPFPYFKEEFPKALAELWRLRRYWDIYNGGPVLTHPPARLHRNILRLSEGACTQFIIVNGLSYDKVLHNASRSNYPIDKYYMYVWPHLVNVSSAPMLTYQTNTPSDIQKTESIGATDWFIKSKDTLQTMWINPDEPASTSGDGR